MNETKHLLSFNKYTGNTVESSGSTMYVRGRLLVPVFIRVEKTKFCSRGHSFGRKPITLLIDYAVFKHVLRYDETTLFKPCTNTRDQLPLLLVVQMGDLRTSQTFFPLPDVRRATFNFVPDQLKFPCSPNFGNHHRISESKGMYLLTVHICQYAPCYISPNFG